jgi:O-antigen ligase
VNSGALLLTQTRGAWLAGLVALLFLGILWRPSALVAGLGVLSVGAVVLAGADWASTIRERVQSTFTLEAGISGFESSLGRLALMVTAWRMFLAHPLMGVGLKNFPIAMTLYAPPGMPLAYQMGPDQVLTPVEGPHSTYLSLLSEVGLLGFVGLVCWEVAAILRAYRESRHRASSSGVSSTNAPILLASLAVVTVYNFFFEMNQSGTLVFIALLAVAYRTRQPQPNARQLA